MHLRWQAQKQKWVQPITYCKSNPCTCGQDCRTNLTLHTQITGALTSDERTEDKPLILPTDYDDSLFEMAMASLAGYSIPVESGGRV